MMYPKRRRSGAYEAARRRQLHEGCPSSRVALIVGSRCGIGAAGATLLYRLYSEHRSMSGYFTNAVIGCVTNGLGIRRY